MNNESILEQFGANASSYAISKVHAKGSSLKRLVDLLQPQADWQVLDIATGAGHTSFMLAPHVAQVRATDITPQMRRQARQLAEEKGLENVIVESADAHDLPYPDNNFDLVTCRIAPHHFADVAKFVREAARVLKAGGRLAIVDNIVPPGPVGDYVNAFEKLRDPSHGRCLSAEEWLAVGQDAGLALQQQESLAKEMDFDFWAQRHDENGRRTLKALLSQAGPAVQGFLQPQIAEQGTRFRLLEGIFIYLKIR